MSVVKSDTRITKGLQDFVGLGCVEETREIFGNKFLMTTIPAASIRRITVECSGLDLAARDRIMKIEILSRAIRSINGHSPFPQDAESSQVTSQEEGVEVIRKILGNIEQPIIDVLHENYLDLVKAQNEFIEELKKKFEMTKNQS